MNKRGTGLAEVIFMIVMLSCLVVPFIIFKLWSWVWTMGAIAIVVGIAEVVSSIKDRKTISQKFWIWSKTHKWQAWTVCSCLMIGWLMLMFHLLAKII